LQPPEGWFVLLSGVPAPLNAIAYLIGVNGKQKKRNLSVLCASAVNYYRNSWFMLQNKEKSSLRSLIDLIGDRQGGIDCIGLSGSAKAYFTARLHKEYRVPIVVIVPSAKDGQRFVDDLRFFLEKDFPHIFYFPPYNILPFKRLSYHSETAAKRVRILYQLIDNGTSPIVVATIGSLMQKLIPKQEMINYAELIMVGEEIDRDILIGKLVSGGYVRSVIVEEPGDFCIRGGILDIFSPLYSEPLRIELFGDTVESLRFFSAVSQRTTSSIMEAVILPARETILKSQCTDQIISRIRQQASVLDIPVTKVRDLVDCIKKEGVFPGIESLISLIYPELDTLFDYLSDRSLIIQIEPGELEKAANESAEQAINNYLSARNESRLCVEPDTLYLKWSKIKNILSRKNPITIKMLPVSTGEGIDTGIALQSDFAVEDNATLRMELERSREAQHPLLPLSDWVNDHQRSGNLALFVCSTRSRADRLKWLLAEYGVDLKFIDGFLDVERGKGSVCVCIGQVSSGFVWPEEFLAIIIEDEVFGAKPRRRKISRRKGRPQFLAFEDLKQDDLVVHIEHGIGQYKGLVKLRLNGATNDFLLVLYKDDDKLYLPVDRMSMIQKYMGVEGITPVLDKMGGKSWDRVKRRVKKSVEKIAGELLKLYAARRVEKGHAFNREEGEFEDFASAFNYEETTDQLKAIENVLSDMEQSTPMDRLVCGDVGYGKTEVALRSSFVAVYNGKQVAVLVPTTVLAEQHFATFSVRFERSAVNIACLSRFRPMREQRAIIRDLKAGKIDIVIGTHRLLQKDVAFKDLGLIVLDEEQRFGVNHKEKLKKLRHTVDVLALTATPIPRTLHLSLMGIRDISIISTPPEHRHAIITYISEFDDAIISDAIRKELDRRGQIFFVHNNIHSIWTMAKHLQDLVPEVRLGVAHGRLDEDELEAVMLRFVKKEIDMLLCTTIIESGLDIPSANTILVNRADRFGLAQMYQLRGRVGRADEQAYAYLFIPNESILTRNAQKRLKVLMEHSDLGSGFQIAMNDLKIRGGGTILGASQSGHIAAVGYDMFLKLMENTVSELKGEPVHEDLEPEINVSTSAFIPESYIPDIDQRLSVYRRLARISELQEIAKFKEEMIDRFGALPVEVVSLLLKIMLKVLSIKACVKRLDLTEKQLLIYFSEAHLSNPSGIVDMVVSKSEIFEFTRDHVLKARLSNQRTDGLLIQTKNILKEIIQHVNG